MELNARHAIERPEAPRIAVAPKVETRADGKLVIAGYAAVFWDGTQGTEFEPFRGMKERVLPGAFDRAIREDDVRALFNHDENIILGRTVSRTLRLSVDARGLRYEIDPPDTQVGKDLVESIRRGDVTGSSFGFRTIRQNFVESQDPPLVVRELVEVKLFDVSPVTFPAYVATEAGVRGAEGASEALAAWREESRRAAAARIAQTDVAARAAEREFEFFRE